MAGKSSGLGWTTLSIDDVGGTPVDLRNDFNSVQFATPLAIQDITGIDKFAYERLALLADLSFTGNGAAMNADASKSHVTLANVTDRRTRRTLTITVNGKTLAGEVLFTDFSYNRGADGSLPFTAPAVLADGTIPAWT
jgi:hypothetical protein